MESENITEWTMRACKSHQARTHAVIQSHMVAMKQLMTGHTVGMHICRAIETLFLDAYMCCELTTNEHRQISSCIVNHHEFPEILDEHAPGILEIDRTEKEDCCEPIKTVRREYAMACKCGCGDSYIR